MPTGLLDTPGAATLVQIVRVVYTPLTLGKGQARTDNDATLIPADQGEHRAMVAN